MKRIRGFTLIEVLVAMTIMAMSFSVLFAISSRALDGMRRARDMERRVEFARTRLAELRLIDSVAVGDRAGGSLDDGTSWQVEVLPFIQPVLDGPLRNPTSVVRIHLSLEWQGRNQPQKWEVDSYRLLYSSVTPIRSFEERLRAIANR
jgi:prepilin-type N-terminal cleavage/methylation domain-containing protein